MRRLQSYVNRYGPDVGPKFYHALQSQAAHAGVSARLRRKLDVLRGKAPAPTPVVTETSLPLFPEPDPDGPEGVRRSLQEYDHRPEPEAAGV